MHIFDSKTRINFKATNMFKNIYHSINVNFFVNRLFSLILPNAGRLMISFVFGGKDSLTSVLNITETLEKGRTDRHVWKSLARVRFDL